MFFQRKSNCWNTKYRQIKCRDTSLVEAMENDFNPFDYSPLQSSMLQSNNVGFDLIQTFAPMSQICTPRAIRRSPSITDCSSPRMDSSFLQQQWTSSSETSDASSSDLSDMMATLSLSQAGTQSPLTEQELANLRALHTLTSGSGLCSVRLPPPLLHSMIHLDNRWSYNEDVDLLEKVARFHRNQAASFFEAACRWEGDLPRRFPENPTFSCKVFLGGVPWDVTEESLVNVFSQFGKVRVEWPGKDQSVNQPKGYVYIVFESEKQVKILLNNCSCEVSNFNSEKWSFRISSKKMKSKEVEVIPWCLTDSNFVQLPSQKLDPHTTVFVGALHGMLNAESLFTIMNELFGGVVYTGIDTDKFKYPIGSARVTFNNWQSYMKAVTAAFVEIKTSKFTKKVQVDPYLEDSSCSYCMVQQGPYFCREFTCFRYFCRSCWGLYHQSDLQSSHKPLMRSSKNNNLSFP
uniref:RRM domain-containing protein n=1 Tax=Homalodisca liturata TaxID=320908 RepID=A0A1B6JV04_9HEMI